MGRLPAASILALNFGHCAMGFLKLSGIGSGFGFPLRLAVPLGIVELVCILLYVVPPTSILGAILLTGYLGGAIAIQLPTGNSLFGEVLFPIYIGVILWGGIYLRDERLRTLIPLRS